MKNRVIAVLPAYNAERTLAKTMADIPPGAVDEIILVDDGIGKHVVIHEQRGRLADQGTDQNPPRQNEVLTGRNRGSGSVAVEEIHFDARLNCPVIGTPDRDE
jgi:hypothetical protein